MPVVELRPAGSLQEFRQILQDYVQTHGEQWITGGNWDHEKWETKKEPVKEMLDDFSADTPVAVGRFDGHMLLANSFKSFLDAGINVCFGSDWEVAPLNSLAGVYAAVIRRTLVGKNPDGWLPAQKISVEDAIKCYTLNSAYAALEENIKGSIEPGKLADFVVLTEDILSIDPVEIVNVKVDQTIFDGEVMYQR